MKERLTKETMIEGYLILAMQMAEINNKKIDKTLYYLQSVFENYSDEEAIQICKKYLKL